MTTRDFTTTPLGIDVGGSFIKSALVDTATGTLRSKLDTRPTPRESTPENLARSIEELIHEHGLDPNAAVGVALPARVEAGRTIAAANLGDGWSDCEATSLFADAIGRRVALSNDADAAGVAESRFGAARGAAGTVIVTTIGTGIGSCLLVDGVVARGTELGHLRLGEHLVDSYVSARAKLRDGLSDQDWATDRLQPFCEVLDRLFRPTMIVIGGGITSRAIDFLSHLKLRVPVVPSRLGNAAGVVGAAAGLLPGADQQR